MTRGDIIVNVSPFRIPESFIALITSSSDGRKKLEQPAPNTINTESTNNNEKIITLFLICFGLLIMGILFSFYLIGHPEGTIANTTGS
jgi:hypothetical protein